MRIAPCFTVALSAVLVGSCATGSPIATLNSTLEERFHTFAQFATAAYCPEMIDGLTNSTLHGTGFADATTVMEFNKDATIGGNIAVSPSEKLIVLSFRGTDPTSIRDVTNDFKLCPRQPKFLSGWFAVAIVQRVLEILCRVITSPPEDSSDDLLPLCSCRVHTGFWNAFSGIKNQTRQVIQDQLRANPGFSVVVTGHSLGGAVATIAGAYLRKAGINNDIYTFGSPRVGDEAFATFVSSQPGGRIYRITNRADPVTVSPGILAGFAHTTPEYWFRDGLEARSFKKCDGFKNILCSAQFLFNPMRLSDHASLGYTRGVNICPSPTARSLGLDITRPDGITPEHIEEWQENVAKWQRDGTLDNSTVFSMNMTRPSMLSA